MAASRGFRKVACWLAGLIVSFCLLLPLPAGRAQDHEVDLALVLAIDCSFSVDSREFALQMEGIGRAFMTDEVKAAIAQGTRQRIAVAVVQWSDERNQMIVLPWTLVAGSADADEGITSPHYRVNSVLAWKRAISYSMVSNNMQWNETAQIGNPNHLQHMACIIHHMKRFQTQCCGVAS